MMSDSPPIEDLAPEKKSESDMSWPAVRSTRNPTLEAAVQRRLSDPQEAAQALGRLEALAIRLACIQAEGDTPQLVFDRPQLVVFAADHGVTDEGISEAAQDATREQALQWLTGKGAASALAALHGFDLTLVDAGVASYLTPLPKPTRAPLLLRKIGFGTRNMLLTQAMSPAQARASLQAGMDVVRHLPGNVLALSGLGVSGNASAALVLSRLCGVPLADACGIEAASDPERAQRKLERLFTAAKRHRKATAALDVLAALGGFEIGMLCGAMIQAASERRIILVDDFVAATAALLARELVPEVADYLIFAHRSVEAGHRLLLIHLQAQPLLDMELSVGQGAGALLAWPMLLAVQRLLEA